MNSKKIKYERAEASLALSAISPPPRLSAEMTAEISLVCIFVDRWICLLCHLGVDLVVYNKGSTRKNSLNKGKVSFSLKESLLPMVSILKVTSWSNMVAEALAVLPTSQGRHRRVAVFALSLDYISLTSI